MPAVDAPDYSTPTLKPVTPSRRPGRRSDDAAAAVKAQERALLDAWTAPSSPGASASVVGGALAGALLIALLVAGPPV
jgi:hypothetical protein